MIEIEYSADGLAMTGFLADGSSGKPVPGILVAHEAPGVNDHIKSRTRALAQMGYVAFALDLYGEIEFAPSTATARHAELMAMPGAILRRATAALEVLAAQKNVDAKRLAVVGFCQGGITALELARGNAPIRCAIGFHPGLKRPAGSPDGQISAKVLMLIGDNDPVIPLNDRVAFAEEMNAANADWQMHLFGGVGHSFTNRAVDAFKLPGIAYDANADRKSWLLMQAALDEIFFSSSGERDLDC